MSFMSVDGGTGNGSAGSFWNFSNKEKDNYAISIKGVVREIQLVPKTKFGTREIDRYDDGNPKRNLRLYVDDEGEETIWEFSPGGRDKRNSGGEDKRSEALKALVNALLTVDKNAKDIEECLGMFIEVSTEEPPGNFTYSKGNPRPWHVKLDNTVMSEHRGCTVKPDWEREKQQADAGVEPPDPNDPNDFRNKIPKNAGMPDVSVYDEDIPF